jgi:hypothetical protein
MTAAMSADASARVMLFCEAEWRLMQDLTERGRVYAFLVYMYLRWHMDGQTRVVGAKRRISYRALREHLERRPERRSNWTEKDVPTSFIREQLRHLERCGAIRRVGADSKLVFEMVLATPGKSVSVKHSTMHSTPSGAKTSDISAPSGVVQRQAHHDAQHTSVLCIPPPIVRLVVDIYNRDLVTASGGLWQPCRFVGDRTVNIVMGVVGFGEKYAEPEWWEAFFQKVQASDWLMGRVTRRGRDTFTGGNLAWLCERAEKIVNGEYE